MPPRKNESYQYRSVWRVFNDRGQGCFVFLFAEGAGPPAAGFFRSPRSRLPKRARRGNGGVRAGARGRVDLGVAAQAPHSPVRAQLTHTVLQDTDPAAR
jgi:hypothetical protein